MKEKILQALTTFKGYLFSSDKWLHLAAGFIIAFFVGLFVVLSVYSMAFAPGLRPPQGKSFTTNSARREPRKFGTSFFSVVGVLAGVLNVLLARLVFHFIA